METVDKRQQAIAKKDERIAKLLQQRASLVRSQKREERARFNSMKYVLGAACLELAQRSPSFVAEMSRFLAGYIKTEDGKGWASLVGSPFARRAPTEADNG